MTRYVFNQSVERLIFRFPLSPFFLRLQAVILLFDFPELRSRHLNPICQSRVRQLQRQRQTAAARSHTANHKTLVIMKLVLSYDALSAWNIICINTDDVRACMSLCKVSCVA